MILLTFLNIYSTIFILFPNIILTSTFVKIQHLQKDLYMCDKNISKNNHRSPTACSEPTVFELESGNDGYLIIKSKESNLVFDIANHIKDIIMYSKHGGMNQKFQIRHVSSNNVVIVGLEKCITYIQNNNSYEVHKCEGSPFQLFEIVGVDDEKHKLFDFDNDLHFEKHDDNDKLYKNMFAGKDKNVNSLVVHHIVHVDSSDDEELKYQRDEHKRRYHRKQHY